jgi:hypothetical protein
MINAECAHREGYTGKGVYVAVLDTGLVPNWRDYFPANRIATKLGKGFYEPIHVNPKTGERLILLPIQFNGHMHINNP